MRVHEVYTNAGIKQKEYLLKKYSLRIHPPYGEENIIAESGRVKYLYTTRKGNFMLIEDSSQGVEVYLSNEELTSEDIVELNKLI